MMFIISRYLTGKSLYGRPVENRTIAAAIPASLSLPGWRLSSIFTAPNQSSTICFELASPATPLRLHRCSACYLANCPSRQSAPLLPGPLGVVAGIADLVRHGLLLKYVVASLFRVTWGFVLGCHVGHPHGTHHRLVSQGRDGVQSADSNSSPYFAAGLDSHRNSLVRRRRSRCHLSHLPGLLFPVAC